MQGVVTRGTGAENPRVGGSIPSLAIALSPPHVPRLYLNCTLPIVARAPQGCTDTPADYRGGPKPPWCERKLHYLEHLRNAPPDELRVSLADKVDNARAIAADYRLLGKALWSRFSVGSRDQLWYYRSL